VSVAGVLALDQVLEILVQVNLFWDFNRLSKAEYKSKVECKSKQRSRDLGPF
jgi:hypothetical protein